MSFAVIFQRYFFLSKQFNEEQFPSLNTDAALYTLAVANDLQSLPYFYKSYSRTLFCMRKIQSLCSLKKESRGAFLKRRPFNTLASLCF